MLSPPAASRSDAHLREVNRRFYDPFWSATELVAPERFNTWPLVASLARPGQARLEVGPGLRPRLPLAGTAFVDQSPPAVRKLRARGAHAVAGGISELPFPDRTFELVAALDIVEHVDDEDRALGELARVAAAGAALLVSVPLHPARWTRFDELVGHRRRYEPERLRGQLARHGFAIERSAAYGMQPASPRLVAFGLWALEHRPRRARWIYRHVILPLGLRLQKKLELSDGMIASERVDEIFLLCRRQVPRRAEHDD
jgi:SAM-dependent methyltransferase